MCNVAYHFKVNCIVNKFFRRVYTFFRRNYTPTLREGAILQSPCPSVHPSVPGSRCVVNLERGDTVQVTMSKPYIKYKIISSSRSWDICDKNVNGQTNGQTDGRMDRRTRWLQYSPLSKSGGIISSEKCINTSKEFIYNAIMLSIKSWMLETWTKTINV
jgi:hypothetical protein